MGDKNRPLLVFIGGQSCQIGSGLDLEGHDVLFLDTDMRTAERVQGEFTLVADDLVNGEGCGGNLNLARVCFKKEMERLGGMVLGRPLLVLVCYMEGATSVAGAVEINSLMIKVGLPSFVVLLGEIGTRKPTERSLNLSNLLITGPLRPGARVDLLLNEGDEGKIGSLSEENLSLSLKQLLSGVDDAPSVQIPTVAWSLLREHGGPFRISSSLLDKGTAPDLPGMGDISPSINILELDGATTTSEVSGFISNRFGDIEGIHFGIIEEGQEGGKWRITTIYPSKKDPQNMDENRGSGKFRDMDEIMGNMDTLQISPERGL